MGQDENTNPFNGNETPVFETPTPTPAPEAPTAPVPTPEPTPAPEAPAPAPAAEAPAAPAPIPVTKPGQVSESVSQLSSYNRLGMRPSRNLSAREELDRIAPKAPVAPAAVAKEKGPRDPKIRIIIVLLIVTAIALVAMLVISAMSGNGGIFGGKKNSAVSTSGEANLDVIFDDKAYLPYYENGLWGYKNPENGEVVLSAKYTAAERFYGDYAAVTFVDGDTEKSAIIDKEGNIKLEQRSDVSSSVRYDIEHDVWYANDNVYDGSLQQLNIDGMTGKYVGAGFISNTKNEKGKGTTVLLTNASKKTIYDCSGLCSIFVSDNGEFAAVNIYEQKAKIIRLSDGNEEYVASTKDNRILKADKNVFVEQSKSGVVKYLVVNNGIVEKNDYEAEDKNLPSGYTSKQCSNGNYSVLKSDETLVECLADGITGPSEIVQDMLAKNNRETILFNKKTELIAYNLNGKKEEKTFGEVIEYQYALNSPIITIKNSDGTKLYSLFSLSSSIDVLDGDTVNINDNYVLVYQGEKVKTYNGNLREI